MMKNVVRLLKILYYFIKTYLCRDSIFDYLQSLLINISVVSGQPYMSYSENRMHVNKIFSKN